MTDPFGLFNIQLAMAIEYNSRVKHELSKGLNEGNNALDPKYVGKMQNLVERLGGVGRRYTSDIFPIKREVHCFQAEFFNGVYCLRDFRGKGGVNTLLITHHQEIPDSVSKGIVVYDVHDPALITYLHENRFLEYDIDLVRRRLREIEADVIVSKGMDIASMSKYQKRRAAVDNSADFPEEWRELSEIDRRVTNGERKVRELLDGISYRTQIKLSRSKEHPEVIDHLLARLDPTDVVRVYKTNLKKLARDFPKMPQVRQRYVAYALLNYNNGGQNE